MRKATKIFGVGLVVLTIGLAMACGDGSGLGSNGVFGKLPGLVDKYTEQGMALIQEANNLTDKDGQKKFKEKLDALKQQAEEEFAAEYTQLENAEMPTEVQDDVPLKVEKPFTLDKDGKQDSELMQIVALVEAKEEIASRHDYALIAVDGDGTPLTVISRFVNFDDLENAEKFQAPGTKAYARAKVELDPWNTEALAKTKKLLIISRDSDPYNQAKKAGEEAQKAYQTKIEEAIKGAVQNNVENVKK